MERKKIKIFLGGFINVINAQNLNCLALATHLDKKKYEVYTMVFKKGNIDLPFLHNVKLWTAYFPYRIYKYILRFWAVLRCDVLYLPKGDMVLYTSFLLKLFRKKSFLTVEGVYIGSNYSKAIDRYGSVQKLQNHIMYCDRVYSISSYMANYNREHVGIKSDKVLFLGVETSGFRKKNVALQLSNIVFIGNNMKDKGIEDFFEMAGLFPYLTFHIVGGGLGVYNPELEVAKRGLQNIKLHGVLNHDQLSDLLYEVQLMYFPSRSEGFPKVILECAAAGVPSIVYSDYGADEWISTGINGFVVDKLEDASFIINDLMNYPDKLKFLSDNALFLSKQFDWKIIIKDWEEEIENLMYGINL